MAKDKHWTSWRKRRARAGFRRVEIWVPTALRKALKDAMERLRATGIPKGSRLLVRAVPRELDDEIQSLVDGRLASAATSSRRPAFAGAGHQQVRAADDTAGTT